MIEELRVMGSHCPGIGPLRRVAAVLEYVRTHPQMDVSVPVLAARAGFSPFHFQRIFRVAVGETVGDYVRNRRLQQAAIELRESEIAITEIALKTGYETPSAFTRAFGARYGMSPTAFRASATNPIAPMTNMDITIQVLPTFHLLGARHVGPHSSVPDVWRKVFDHACKQRLLSDTAQLIGLSYDDPASADLDAQRYDACFTVGRGTRGDEILRPIEVGGGRFAIYRLVGPYPLIGHAFDRLFDQLVFRDGVELRDAPCMEFYRNDPDVVAHADLITDLAVPIL
jgi:AraC family transcriptional regulator